MSYEIVTQPMGWQVKRKDSDFKALREYLVRNFPQTIVPPLPPLERGKRLSKRAMRKKETYIERFLS